MQQCSRCGITDKARKPDKHGVILWMNTDTGRYCSDCFGKSPNIRWISVKDRLPEKDGYYLLYYNDDDQNMSVGTLHIRKDGSKYFSGCDSYFYADCATHWMPLPEPPATEPGNV